MPDSKISDLSAVTPADADLVEIVDQSASPAVSARCTVGGIRGAREVNAQTGTSYTLVIGDANDVVTMDNASANTVTIPDNASVAFAVGTVVDVVQKGAGATTVTGTASPAVTVNGTSGGSVAVPARYNRVRLLKVATNTWTVSVGGSSIAVEDEGVAVLSATTLNFTGAGVAVTDAGSGQADVTISGGGSSGQVTTVTLASATSCITGVGTNQYRIPYATEHQDDGGWYDSGAANGKMTPAAGTYLCNASVLVTGGASTTARSTSNVGTTFTAFIGVYNSSDVFQRYVATLIGHVDSLKRVSGSMSGIVVLASGEYLTVQVAGLGANTPTAEADSNRLSLLELP